MKKIELYPYQKEGVAWLQKHRLRLLADTMGLGKSAQTIRAADELKIRRILIVCPSIARITWEREFSKWSEIQNRKIKILKKRSDVASVDDEICICSFDYASHNAAHLSSFRFDLLVVDESHFLKSLDAKRTQAILARTGIAHSVKRAFYLTGTPMPNYPNELWPLLYTYGITTLNYNAFVKKFCETYSFNGNEVVCGINKNTIPELKEMLNSIMLRRTIKDANIDLPDYRINELPVEAALDGLTPELKAQFYAVEEFLKSGFTGALDQMAALEMLAKSVSSLRRYCVMKKIKPVCELISDELQNKSYEKIIVFCIHREAARETERLLAPFGAVSITGEISADQRQRNIDAFQNDPECKAIVINIAAGGTNITLTAASEVMFLEQDYVPGNNAQAIARAHRIGQKNSINVRIAALADSVDEAVQSILVRKTRGICELMNKAT